MWQEGLDSLSLPTSFIKNHVNIKSYYCRDMREARSHRTIGNAKGLIVSMAEDFDEPLDDFKEYME